MVLYTKCIFKEKSLEDGVRISVMSRHTLNDGKTVDIRIKDYDEHLKILAPSDRLIGDYYKRGLSWDDFSKNYLDYIRSQEVSLYVKDLARRALTENISLLCVEETADKCHRKLLAEECKLYEPLLEVVHL